MDKTGRLGLILSVTFFAGLQISLAEVCSYSYIASYTSLYGTRYRTAYNYLYCLDACCGYAEKYCCQTYNANAQTSNVTFSEFVGVALGGLTGAILVIVICLACCVALRRGKPDPQLRRNQGGQHVYTVNPETGSQELQHDRTFTLGQHGRPGRLQTGYMIDLSAPPPAYEHVVLTVPGTDRRTENNNNSSFATDQNSSVNASNANEQSSNPDDNNQQATSEAEPKTDAIPRYQSVMRKGRWRTSGAISIWTSTDDIGAQSTETLNSILDTEGETPSASTADVSRISGDIDTRISDSNQEYVTHL